MAYLLEYSDTDGQWIYVGFKNTAQINRKKKQAG